MSGSLALLCLELLFTKPQDRKLTLPRWYETLAASYCKAHGLSADAFSSALHLAIFVSVSAGGSTGSGISRHSHHGSSTLTLVYRDRELQPEAQWPPQP